MKWGVADTSQHLIRNLVHNVFILPEQEQGSSVSLTWKVIPVLSLTFGSTEFKWCYMLYKVVEAENNMKYSIHFVKYINKVMCEIK